jgi:putative ABC transport system substrate-binding protein
MNRRDFIAGLGGAAAWPLAAATKTIPIVFVSVADPLTQGFVSNMRQPGGNVTGFSESEFSLGGKWLNLLKEIAPGLTTAPTSTWRAITDRQQPTSIVS